MADALKRRQGLAAQLGASLYEITKDNAELRQGREGLFDGIAAIDGERARLQAEIDQLEAESAARSFVTRRTPAPRQRFRQRWRQSGRGLHWGLRG